MDRLDFDFFFERLKNHGTQLDETQFYFADDEERQSRWLGFLPQYDKPYWVGVCDIPDGTEFVTAEELVDAPIFSNQSLRKRWNEVRIISVQGASLDEWSPI